VNPVLREGNSDRRAPAVKEYARKHPHAMGAWPATRRPTSRPWAAATSAATRSRSPSEADAGVVRIEHVAADGTVTVLKDGLRLEAGEVLDATFMSRRALRAFLAEQVADAKRAGVLFSLHLKATMMKVSDPIIFGHACACSSPTSSTKHAPTLRRARRDANNGFGDVSRRSPAAGGASARPSRPTSGGVRERPRAGDGELGQAASPTCTCRATSSSTPRCRR
jgi:isocitrate dehydrogenase